MRTQFIQSEGARVRVTSRPALPGKALCAVAVAIGAALCAPIAMGADADAEHGGHLKWVASWATSPSSYFVYAAPIPQNQALGFSPTKYAQANIQPDLAFPFPDAKTSGATAHNQTIRSIVKPDLWGRTMRVKLSNVFGDQPLTFDAVTVGLQEYAANVVPGMLRTVRFQGSHAVTIPPGQEVWSDAVRLSWAGDGDDPLLQGRNLAVSYSVQGDSGHMTQHNGANMTSFITGAGSGNHAGDEDGFAYEYTTTTWFFLTTLDVEAAQDTTVVCAFGDSITDGTHTTLNDNDRWANVLSRRLHDAYGNKVSVVKRRSAATVSSRRPSSTRPPARRPSTGSTATCSACRA